MMFTQHNHMVQTFSPNRSDDAFGNCTAMKETGGATTAFTYNDRDLVTRIDYSGGTSNYFHYDGQDRRFAMADSNGLSYFTWDQDGMNLLAEKSAAGTVTRKYTHGPTPVPGIGSVIEAEDVSSSTYKYPHMDHRGSVSGTTDANEDAKDAYTYNAYGRDIASSESSFANRFEYQSNWIALRDSGGELALSPGRVYHRDMGIFLSKDRIGEEGATNLYRYAGGVPTRNVDPMGLQYIGPGYDPDYYRGPQSYGRYSEDLPAGVPSYPYEAGPAVRPSARRARQPIRLGDRIELACTQPYREMRRAIKEMSGRCEPEIRQAKLEAQQWYAQCLMGMTGGAAVSADPSAGEWWGAFARGFGSSVWDTITSMYQMSPEAYEKSIWGQTQGPKDIYYYGTRTAYGVSALAALVAAGLIAWEAITVTSSIARVRPTGPDWSAIVKGVSRITGRTIWVRHVVRRLGPGGEVLHKHFKFRRFLAW